MDEVVVEMKNSEVAVEDKNTKASALYVHRFNKPFEYEGKKHITLNFYWDRLTGKDMIAIENEMQAMSEFVIAPEISASFLCKMAGKAAGVGGDLLEALPIREFSKIKNEARDFLVSAGY